MKRPSFFILTLTPILLTSISSVAQIKPQQFGAFIGDGKIISSSGPGLEQSSGDILLELSDPDDPDVESLMLLRSSEGKLSKIVENTSLMMGSEILGTSGGNYPELSDNTLSIDYTLGSNSATSDISIVFERNSDGHYYFESYTSISWNYGVENLFARQKITARQTGKLNFGESSESKILEHSKMYSLSDAEEQLYKVAKRYIEYVPEGWRLAAFAVGDLNLDESKEDLLLVLYNEENCRIQLLLQQVDRSYIANQSNATLLVIDDTFNINNLKTVIKDGYFTLEQRIAIDDNAFDHRYITFKYDDKLKNWLLRRYDVEHFSDFDTQPSKDVLHLTEKNWGTISFSEMKKLPTDFYYEPETSTISGTLVTKQFYGPPNYGETPEKGEKVYTYILETDYPINVFAAKNQADPETADKTIREISEIQVYATDNKINLKNAEGKKVKLQGVLQSGVGGNHYTKVLMEAREIMIYPSIR